MDFKWKLKSTKKYVLKTLSKLSYKIFSLLFMRSARLSLLTLDLGFRNGIVREIQCINRLNRVLWYEMFYVVVSMSI